MRVCSFTLFLRKRVPLILRTHVSTCTGSDTTQSKCAQKDTTQRMASHGTMNHNLYGSQEIGKGQRVENNGIHKCESVTMTFS